TSESILDFYCYYYCCCCYSSRLGISLGSPLFQGLLNSGSCNVGRLPFRGILWLTFPFCISWGTYGYYQSGSIQRLRG
ncbi:mCG145594, partial [Mus musculus]